MAKEDYSNEAYVYWFYNKYNFKTYFGSRAAYEGSYKDDFMTNYNSSATDEEFFQALENGELVGEVIAVFTGETYEEVGKRAVVYENDLIELYWDNVGKEHSYNHYSNGKFSKIGTKQTEKWKREASIRMSGENNPMYKTPLPEKSLKQMIETKKAKYASGEIVIWNKDKPGCFSYKARKQMSDTITAKYASGEIVAWNKNKTDVYSDETLREMGKGRRGKKPHNRLEIDLDLIKKMYLDDKISVNNIAKTVGVAKGTIIGRLKELGVYNPDKRFQAKKITIDRDILYDLYCVQKKSVKAISKILDKKYDMVLFHLKQYNLYY